MSSDVSERQAREVAEAAHDSGLCMFVFIGRAVGLLSRAGQSADGRGPPPYTRPMAATTGSSKAPRFEAVHADASEQIAHAIRLYIERGGLQPGDRIGTEHELSREFGVSRPTLREGLRRLAGSHLIRVQKGRAGGVFVENTVTPLGRRTTRGAAVLGPEADQPHRAVHPGVGQGETCSK